MDRVLVSVRGYVEVPSLVEIDLKVQAVCDVIEVGCGFPRTVPSSKRGFTGIQYGDAYLVAATWDRICLLDPRTYKVCKTISDSHFSDLHSIHIDGEGVIWVANTNLDGIYRIQNGKVEPFWFAWDPQDPELPDLDRFDDFRALSKQDIPFYGLHVNGVFSTQDKVFVSCLGPTLKARWLRKQFVRFGILRERISDGKLFVIDRQAREVIRTFRLDGLHNCVPGRNGKLYFTEYYGNALVVLDRERLTVTRRRLHVPPYRKWGYLTRGVLPDGDRFWVGHTVLRGRESDRPGALVRCYYENGEWTGSEIRLPGYAGVYDLIEKR
jgi:hypothetical protein